MVFGVAVVVSSLIISALVAAVVDTVYQAAVHRTWPVKIPPIALAVVVLSVVAGASIGSMLG